MIVGRLTEIKEEREVRYIAKIIPNGNVFDVKLYVEILNSGGYSDDLLQNIWASTIASAKRRICQDNGWKSKDFKWEVIE